VLTSALTPFSQARDTPMLTQAQALLDEAERASHAVKSHP
jgi:hypothetical protein